MNYLSTFARLLCSHREHGTNEIASVAGYISVMTAFALCSLVWSFDYCAHRRSTGYKSGGKEENVCGEHHPPVLLPPRVLHALMPGKVLRTNTKSGIDTRDSGNESGEI